MTDIPGRPELAELRNMLLIAPFRRGLGLVASGRAAYVG